MHSVLATYREDEGSLRAVFSVHPTLWEARIARTRHWDAGAYETKVEKYIDHRKAEEPFTVVGSFQFIDGEGCQGHETTDGSIGSVEFCDGTCS
jgi:hypothetical protein